MFTYLHTNENLKTGEVFAGGDHSFILLGGHLKKKDRWMERDNVSIPDSDHE